MIPGSLCSVRVQPACVRPTQGPGGRLSMLSQESRLPRVPWRGSGSQLQTTPVFFLSA